MVGAMMSTAIEGMLAGSLAECLASGLWPAARLAAVQKEFAEVNLLTPWSVAMQRERAFALESMRRLASPWRYPKHGLDFIRLLNRESPPAQPDRTFTDKFFAMTMLAPPRGWFYQNMARFAAAPDLISALDATRQRIDGGKYLLYSIGWNIKDDAGTTDPSKNSLSQPEQWSDDKGDWVWQGVPKG